MAKAKDFKLVLFCAGATEWDREGRLSGAADLPMCATGLAKVEEAVSRLEGVPLSTVISAPDEASMATAGLLAAACATKVRKIEGLSDMDLGLWEGRLGSDLVERSPTAYRQWLDDPASVSVPEGESLTEAEGRILGELIKALEKVKEEHPSVGVVLRPIAWALVRCWLEGLPANGIWSVREAEESVVEHRIGRDRLRAARESSRPEA